MSKKQKLSTESYKGVRDFYPEDQAFLNYFLNTCRQFVERMGYVEYHASILEPAELYRSKGAKNAEIVQEQTYTFTDRGGREVTLRPEMTPTVARMVAAKRRELGFPLRWYSIPNVFRYERAQRGRLREHWQLNVDLFGSRSFYSDAEVIGIAYGLMTTFGAEEKDFVIKVSSRMMFNEIADELHWSADKKKSVFEILDRKNKMSAEDFETALRELDVPLDLFNRHLPPVYIKKMIDEFQSAGISNIVYDPSIVRGFDYYTGMVFEVFDTHPKNNRSLFGGGRYDNLTALFDDEAVPGVGFGMGDTTIHDFLEVRDLLPKYAPPTHMYVAIPSAGLAFKAQVFAAELRRQGVNIAVDFGEKKLGDQIKTANRHKIPFLIVVGENELLSGAFVVRELATGVETKLSRTELASFFLNLK